MRLCQNAVVLLWMACFAGVLAIPCPQPQAAQDNVSTSRQGSSEELLQISPYRYTRSISDQTPEELLEGFQGLKGLTLAQNQDELGPVLQKTGARVEEFLRNFPNTASMETVNMSWLDEPGKRSDGQSQKFQYLFISHGDDKNLRLEEQRTDRKGRPARINGSFMITSGYAAVGAYFHPVYRSGSDFRLLGRAETGARDSYVIAFAQHPDALIQGIFEHHGTSLSLLVRGIAVVDSETYEILRMRTDLLSPLSQAGLYRHTTDVTFEGVQIGDRAAPLWLPHEVVVTINWRNILYKNRHRYSEWALFTVESIDGGKELVTPRP